MPPGTTPTARMLASSGRRTVLHEHPIDVPQDAVRDHHRLQVSETIPHGDLDDEGWQPDDQAPVVDDPLDFVPRPPAPGHVHGANALVHQAVDGALFGS